MLQEQNQRSDCVTTARATCGVLCLEGEDRILGTVQALSRDKRRCSCESKRPEGGHVSLAGTEMYRRIKHEVGGVQSKWN